MRVAGPTGAKPTMEQSVKRNSWTALGILGVRQLGPLLGGLLSLVAVILIAVRSTPTPSAGRA